MKKHSKKDKIKHSGKPDTRRHKNPIPQEQRLRTASLYGFHAVREAWLNENRRVQALYCTQSALDGFQEALETTRKKGLERPAPQILNKQSLEKILPLGAVHQGLALDCSALDDVGIEDILIRERKNERSLLIILDQVTDPHNVGAILRSACAFGAAGMIVQKKHAPELTGVLAKTACGALEHVPVAFETNLSRCIETLQENGYFVYGLDERGAALATANIGGKSVLVLGAEGPGLRRLVKEHCDGLLALPMRGPMPSINVSNAAAVALCEFSKN
ncbi:MAG TPA: 23S rRNA (guanosine(2251)-2'-O)-methyltransferase RlmB [Alphaproteobacteria bacterium]|nr:23S rRNA (guanosine(2251)-2'-O)-methyltransferase RlmB [Alphaproteobacteria bacterium]USO05424.1 MAG: 23S rRNA (guanosine(2251)-2'-O)-methyltransferase RlmB [Rhodospirillales bacterium]HOO82843.1 23S rRNA (guanosine(2251)-2'-O)-methyltransferase RlmB [Alphaproteobacteria bacterium]